MPPSDQEEAHSPARKRVRKDESLRALVKRFLHLDDGGVDALSPETFQQLARRAQQVEEEISKAKTRSQHFEEKAQHFKEKAQHFEEEAQHFKEKASKAEKYSLGRLIKKPPTMSLKAVGNEKSHTGKSKHVEAKTKEHEVELEEIGDCPDVPSRLLLKFGADDEKGGKLEEIYATEGDVSGFITAAMEDAKKLVESSTKRKLYIHHELSLFSDRPDHLVLFDQETNDAILAVEDKKPWDSKEGEEIPPPVLGQVFDYIMELRALGHSAPFVVLSNFRNSWLFWQPDEDSNNLVKTKDKLGLALKSFPLPTSPTRCVGTTKKTPSPPELVGEEKKHNGNITGSEFCDDFERDNMLNSKAYNSDSLVRLFYTAILCGLARNPAAPVRRLKRSEGYDGISLKFDETSYKWGRLRLAPGHPVQFGAKRSRGSRPSSLTKATYFAVERIGRGSSSKVFDAYDYEGQRCVIKMYVKRGKDSSGKELYEKVGKDLCKLEAKRLTSFYDFLADKVFYQEIRGFPCVIMPFFEPLTKQQRENSKEGVRACLSKFHDERHWRYSECDIRWRHVGYFSDGGKKQMVMFDLAELEEVDENKFAESVESQIDHLVERLPDTA